MQRAEHQVTGFGRRQRQPDGLEITHLADQDDVGILAQRRPERFGETVRVTVHLALVHQAFLRLVNEFDGVLDGENMMVFVVIDVIDHRGQGGALARTGWPGDHDQPARLHADIAKNLAHPEVFHGQHLGGDGAEYGSGAAILVERIDPEPGHAGYLERKIGLEELLVIPALLVIHDFIDEIMHLPVIHRRQVDAPHIAIDPDHRRQAGRKVQVRSALLGSKGQKFRDIHVRPRRRLLLPLGPRAPLHRSRYNSSDLRTVKESRCESAPVESCQRVRIECLR